MHATCTRRYNSAYDDPDAFFFGGRARPLSEYWHADFRRGDLSKPYVRTRLRRVSRGKYTSGPHQGVKCVIKYFRRRYDGTDTESDYSDTYQLNNDVANYVVDNWNAYYASRRGMSSCKIRVGASYLWEFWGANKNTTKIGRRKPAVVEPYFRHFHHWNSNSGWCDTKSPWGVLMQSLAHFSYHLSNGNFVLCELQGGFSQRSKTPTLVSPAIVSLHSIGGITDLGPTGIYAFFRNHTCTKYCAPHWLTPDFSSLKPNKVRLEFRRKKGTTYWDYGRNAYV